MAQAYHILPQTQYIIFLTKLTVKPYRFSDFRQTLLLTDTQQQGGGVNMEFFISFLVAIAAGVACHYIIKWLDGDDKSNK